MTAETLKPFIPPTTVDHFPAAHSNTTHRQRNNTFLAIILSIIALILVTVLIGITAWHTMRISNVQTEVQTLTRVIDSLQKRLGINYIEDLHDFEKEYTNALIDDDDDNGEKDDDEDDDDDPDDNDEDEDNDKDDLQHLPDSYDDYSDLINKFNSYGDDDLEEEDSVNNSNISDDDNFFDDFEKYQDAKKKKQTRKSRSISKTHNKIRLYENIEPNVDLTLEHKGHKLNFESISNKASAKRHIVSENTDSRRTPLRPRSQRRRKVLPMLKSAKSMSNPSYIAATPAAHFHLNHKVPNRQAAIKVDSYPGDMYIGHPSWTNENNYERYFKVEQGILTVREPGLYYIYAQVCYNNTHDQNGFVIFHGHKPFLQCLNTVPTNLPLKIHTCHTSGLIYLKANETIHLRDFHSDRNVILKETNNRSYFGLIKV